MFKNKKLNKTSAIIIAVISVLLVSACVLAYQVVITDDKVNTITVEKLNAKIEEVIDEQYKEEIKIVADSDNTGPLKVRVAIKASWKTNIQNLYVCEPSPDLTEYLNLGSSDDQWTAITIQEDEQGLFTSVYYVYNQELEPGESTSNLLKKPIEMTGDDEKVLEITVLSQTASPDMFEQYLEGGIS